MERALFLLSHRTAAPLEDKRHTRIIRSNDKNDNTMWKEKLNDIRRHWQAREGSLQGGLDILRHIGPGLLVTVGFIDPGNWASNFAAGSTFGYSLLWVVTLSTLMLIILQHNVAHLGIATGLCLAEAATRFTPRPVSRLTLGSAMLASISTSMAEILGSAIALEMLFDLPIPVGAAATTAVAAILLLSHTYRCVEKGIIAFVSLIGFSFLYELTLSHTDWAMALRSTAMPALPEGSALIIMSILGAVVMPHNLFLHSEVVQSRQIQTHGEANIRHAMKYEFVDTLFAMTVGWAINSAMIILAADAFFANGHIVSSLDEAGQLLTPLLGGEAGLVFALALLMAGLASTVTSGMAAGTIFAGLYDEAYDAHDVHSRTGILLSLLLALAVIFFIGDPFRGLLVSQAVLSLQLPVTVFLQVGLTSSRRVMGRYVNSRLTTLLLYAIAVFVSALNLYLLYQLLTEMN